MKRILMCIFIIIAFSNSLYAWDIIPEWNKNDVFIYKVVVTDDRPHLKNNRWITQEVFKISLKILEKSGESYLIEWKYLPVLNPITKCPLPDDSDCYSWTNDIKQNLKFEDHLQISWS